MLHQGYIWVTYGLHVEPRGVSFAPCLASVASSCNGWVPPTALNLPAWQAVSLDGRILIHLDIRSLSLGSQSGVTKRNFSLSKFPNLDYKIIDDIR